jgi:hypothetical protein
LKQDKVVSEKGISERTGCQRGRDRQGHACLDGGGLNHCAAVVAAAPTASQLAQTMAHHGHGMPCLGMPKAAGRGPFVCFFFSSSPLVTECFLSFSSHQSP